MKNKISKPIVAVINQEVAKRVARDRELFGSTATKALTAMALVVLHDNFGFGAKRLQKFQALMEEQADCVIGEFCTIEDLNKLADELAKRVNLEDISQI